MSGVCLVKRRKKPLWLDDEWYAGKTMLIYTERETSNENLPDAIQEELNSSSVRERRREERGERVSERGKSILRHAVQFSSVLHPPPPHQRNPGRLPSRCSHPLPEAELPGRSRDRLLPPHLRGRPQPVLLCRHPARRRSCLHHLVHRPPLRQPPGVQALRQKLPRRPRRRRGRHPP